MEAARKSEVLMSVIRKMGAGGAGIEAPNGRNSSRRKMTGCAPVRQSAPKFPLLRCPDQSGRERSLHDLTGPNGLLLVFSRSADW